MQSITVNKRHETEYSMSGKTENCKIKAFDFRRLTFEYLLIH